MWPRLSNSTALEILRTVTIAQQISGGSFFKNNKNCSLDLCCALLLPAFLSVRLEIIQVTFLAVKLDLYSPLLIM